MTLELDDAPDVVDDDGSEVSEFDELTVVSSDAEFDG